MKPARVLFLASANAFCWAVGNGMTSTMLVIYLSIEYGAEGLAIALIIAAPKIIGVFRVAAPPVNRFIGDRKTSSVWLYAASGAILLAMSFLTAPGSLPSPRLALFVLIGMWSLYHLLEYFATVSLWSWLNDLMPTESRGSFLGVRDAWMTAGRIVGGLAAAGISYLCAQAPGWLIAAQQQPPTWLQGRWSGYAFPTAIGSLFLIAAIVPLLWLPVFKEKQERPGWQPFELIAPLFDRRYLPLLAFSVWFAASNGLTQSAQGMYPRKILDLPVYWMMLLPVFMRIGQTTLAAPTGWLVDRWGYRPVLMTSQVLVAIGPLFYALAVPGFVWWIAGAWLLWVAYVGLNVGLPAAMLSLAPADKTAPHIGIYFAVSGLAYGLGAIFGGMLFDYCSEPFVTRFLNDQLLDRWSLFFISGFLLRLFGVVFLALLPPTQRARNK